MTNNKPVDVLLGVDQQRDKLLAKWVSHTYRDYLKQWGQSPKEP